MAISEISPQEIRGSSRREYRAHALAKECGAGKPIVRPATPADLDAFYAGNGIRPTVKALVGEIDGEVIAVGGIAQANGKITAFFDITDAARRYPVRIVKAAKQILGAVAEKGATVIHAERDPNEPTARRFLAHLGFGPLDDSDTRFAWRRNTKPPPDL